MATDLDNRRGKVYASAADEEFQADTLLHYIRFKKLDDDFVGVHADLREAISPRTTETSKEYAQLIAGILRGDELLWSEAYAVAQLLDCHRVRNKEDAPLELDTAKLLRAIHSAMEEEFVRVEAANREAAETPSILSLVSACDAAGLKALLESAQAAPKRPAAPVPEPRRVLGIFRRRNAPEEAAVDEPEGISGGVAPFNEVGSEGRTALHYAVFLRDIGCAKVLLDAAAAAGPDVVKAMLEAEEFEGRTAMDFAIALRDSEMVKVSRPGSD